MFMGLAILNLGLTWARLIWFPIVVGQAMKTFKKNKPITLFKYDDSNLKKVGWDLCIISQWEFGAKSLQNTPCQKDGFGTNDNLGRVVRPSHILYH